MSEFIGNSGKKIVITLADWPDAKRLKNAIMREAAKAGLKLGDGMATDALSFIQAAMLVDSSDEVDAALQPCLARCTRGNIKITENTFNDGEARKDYYQIVTACINENCRPLAESLLSVLPAALQGMVKAKMQASAELGQSSSLTTK